jgi:hypothetical protein
MRLAYLSRLAKPFIFAVLGSCIVTATAQDLLHQNVTTHHYDNFRTGWNWNETVLTQANVNANNFALLHTLTVDAQVDAQPLVLSNLTINGTLYPTVVYIVTENNSVYAFDGLNGGAPLVQRTQSQPDHLEPPATQAEVNNCNNNAPTIGINSTPVIDTTTGTLYVVTTTWNAISSSTQFYLHALDVTTLKDKVSELAITSPPGTTARQRPALTLFNGGVLIPFGSFCDTSNTHGFITYANMTEQTDFQTSHTALFDSIWMSGGGAAVSGNTIYFMTGNGGPTPLAPPNTELPHAMVALSGSTSSPLSLTFLGAQVPNPYLYGHDWDYGAGAVLIIPYGAPSSITSTTSPLLVAGAGKVGDLYTFYPNDLVLNGGITSSFYEEVVNIGACWCGESYFTGEDGIGRVVTSTWGRSQAANLRLYTMNSVSGVLSPSTAAVAPPTAKSGGFDGYWTTVSSNETQAGTGVIWAVSGPDFQGAALNLYAYRATDLSQLFATDLSVTPPGYWPNGAGNANIVPVVSNGRVYVASATNQYGYTGGEVTIWGETAGPLPSPPDLVSWDTSECPYAVVSWDASAGATYYQLYSQTAASPWNRNYAGLMYTGPNTQRRFHPGPNQTYKFKVAACNSYGCSAFSTSTGGGTMPSPCP